jgi:hypothetical protein
MQHLEAALDVEQLANLCSIRTNAYFRDQMNTRALKNHIHAKLRNH